MGKHGKRGEYGEFKAGRSGTDNGSGFNSLTPEQKAQEFDNSASDPAGYAERNFTPEEGKHKK